MSRDPWSWLGPGGGESAKLIRKVDWTSTSVGPVDTWPQSLKSLVSMMLHSHHPMFLWWGSDLVQFYNDGYTPSFGVGRHPSAMGQRGRECWAEIWPIIGPEIAGVQQGEATFHEDALVPIFRNGRMEEVYWTYGYSPVREADGSIAGVLVVVTETTSRVVALRRLRTAQNLAELLSGAEHTDDVAHAVVRALAATPEDSPWALAVQGDGNSTVRVPIATSGLDAAGTAAVLAHLDAETRSPSQHMLTRMDLPGVPALPGTPWPEATTHAVVLPLRAGPGGAPYGQLVIGLSPRLPYDAAYREHVLGLERQLTSAAQRIRSQGARLAAEGARRDLLLQAPFAAALMVGPGWRYELANDLYVRMVGRPVVGREWGECFPELLGTPVQAILRKVYEGGETFFANEQLVPLARESDNVVEERFFDFTMVPIRTQGDAVDAMMVVAVEMTTRVQARRDLEQTAAERATLVRELEQSSQAKDQFLAMLGHELRNPLSPIVTALTLMGRRQGGDTSRERAIIARQVKHLVRLVDDLLDVSRVTRGKIELRREDCDVSALVDDALEIVDTLFKRRRHQLQVRVTPNLRWYGDGTRIKQVIANLLSNAARYTPPEGHVNLSVAADGGELVVRVQDDGQGLDAELLPRLFEPFVQGPRDASRSDGGLGLGLAVVKGLVGLHGGAVSANSDGLGRGSEFIVRLPGLITGAPSPPADELKPAAQVGAPSQGKKRVLVVEDNEDAADSLAELLALDGHEVRVARDGPSALVLSGEFEPQVALLDIGLPLMDGYQLVRSLRRDLGDGTCRYFAMTGYGQPGDAAQAASAGFERVLVKPIDHDLLERLLGSDDAQRG
jgi:signal transduction histidine kinase/ActR/RegA family two-component response regulator